MSKKITIQDIAKRADVSIATVSRILNNKGKVKETTKQHVLSVMKEMNFSAPSASSLTDSNSKNLLMCLPDFQNPFYSDIIDGAQTAAHKNGYEIFLIQAKDFYKDREAYENILKSNSFAGLLILSAIPQMDLIEELSLICPVVMCSEYPENPKMSFISINDIESAKKAVNYLISTGRKKIGMINSTLNHKYARHREHGYREAMKEAGLLIDENWIAHISAVDYSLSYSTVLHILNSENRPDAFFTSSDVFAASVINAAQNLNLQVPNHISVIGFDNIEIAKITNPQITTISQPRYQMGLQSCLLLIEKINNPVMPDRQIILETELIVRGSTL